MRRMIPQPRRARRAQLPAAALALAVLTGCGGPAETVTTAVEDTSSAVATARLVLAQDMAGKITAAAASTALDDALKEMQTSRSTVLKLAPATAADRELQQEALSVLDRCAAGFTAARTALSADDAGTPPSAGTPPAAAPSAQDADRALETAEDALSRLGEKVGAK